MVGAKLTFVGIGSADTLQAFSPKRMSTSTSDRYKQIGLWHLSPLFPISSPGQFSGWLGQQFAISTAPIISGAGHLFYLDVCEVSKEIG